MKFKPISLNELISEQEIDQTEIIEGIENNSLLEKIIPTKWHAFVNELIHDYEGMADSNFYEKYKEMMGLDQIWFQFQEYEEANEQNNLLGSLIVFTMVDKGYIVQLDYKEDLEDYESSIKDFWNPTKTKLVQFIIDNDQYYYALLPIDVNMKNLYEVEIQEVK